MNRVSWRELEASAPALARAGQALLYQRGVSLAYLATVRRDGGLRLHPICPVIVAGGLYAFLGSSPKRADLLRDGRYALHTVAPLDRADEFFLAGRAAVQAEPALRTAVSQAIFAMGSSHGADELVFEFRIERALHAAYAASGPAGWPPQYTRWQAPQP